MDNQKVNLLFSERLRVWYRCGDFWGLFRVGLFGFNFSALTLHKCFLHKFVISSFDFYTCRVLLFK